MKASHALAPWLGVVCLALHWRASGAWALEGHKRIAEIAQAVLSEKHKKHISAMLHGNITDFASWEQTMTLEHPETDTLHWHRQDPEWMCKGAASSTTTASPDNLFHSVSVALLRQLGDVRGNVRCDGHGIEGGSLFCALAYFFEHFAHDALLREYPKPKEPIGTPATLQALAKFKPQDLQPFHYLRWLAVLIGDLHQPLHWLRSHNYGRDIKILYQDREYTLLSLWEEVIPQRLHPLPPQNDLIKQYQQQAPAWWDKMPSELFRVWAKQMADTVCDSVYGAIKMQNSTDGEPGLDTPYKLEEHIFEYWANLAEGFTKLGGQRLAFVLDDILEHKRHKAAHKDGRGRHHRRKKWSRNLMINAGIASAVVPLMLLGFHWNLNGGGGSIFSKTPHRKT